MILIQCPLLEVPLLEVPLYRLKLRCILYVRTVWGSHRFDVRVMQSGRMKGQAFVGLPTEQAGEHAVEETNGFMLKGKPMVVVSGSVHGCMEMCEMSACQRCHL